MDYREDILFLKKYLLDNGGEKSINVKEGFRSRFHHTLRVLKWIERLLDDDALDKVDLKVLYLAAIYHDIGYDFSGRTGHAGRSKDIFLERAKDMSLNEEEVEKIAYMIANHSNKKLLQEDISIELCLLLEADMLDEVGALGIMWDCMIKGANGAMSYDESVDHIMVGYNKIKVNPMKTRKAFELWEYKILFVEQYLNEIKYELEEI